MKKTFLPTDRAVAIDDLHLVIPDHSKLNGTAMTTSIANPLNHLFLLFLGLALILTPACEGPAPQGPSPEKMATLLKDAPGIFSSEELKLEGLDGLFLGQSKDEAHEVMGAMCKRLNELDGGRFRGGTYFRGCHTPDHPFIYSFRVGFNPKIQDAVFTLEVKRRPLDQELVRARTWQQIPHIHKELVRRGIQRVEARQFNFLASWDDGVEGPTHLVFGFSETEIERRSQGIKE